MDYIHKQIELMFVLLLATTYTATSFVLSGQCMAPSPCSCSGSSTILCYYNSLTDVPHLGSVTTDEYISKLYLQFQSNKIHSIPANVFQNVSSVNTSSIYFNFDDNMISSIDSLAFAGLENKTTDLLLRNNQLYSLPSVIGKLNKLESLYLEGNPLVSLDSSIITHLSPHLTALGFDMGHFSAWPSALNKLQHLHTLTVQYIPFSHLSLNAFAGFEYGLTSLTLSYTKLFRIPAVVCHLQSLQTFNFDNNAALETNSSLLEPCSHKLTRLTTLSLKNNSLYSFPDVLHSFPTLNTLYLDNNMIRLIHTNVIPYFNSLQTLSLSQNKLAHIPFALNKLKQLITLNLVSNEIITVEDHDLVGLTKLTQLQLQSNPIEYIAPHAFNHNVEINSLYLDSTKLHLIPEAVRSLSRLTTFYFQSNNAECSCKMSYLKGWNVSTVTSFYGTCANLQNQNNVAIKQFLLTDLPNCP